MFGSDGTLINGINPYTGHAYSSRYWKLHKQREKLPIWAHKHEFLRALDMHRCILLEAETGSGKTTQVPQWCVEWLHKKDPNKNPSVCCTQPRRLATFTVAQRVASEMDVELGKEVGYSVRFEEAISHQTKLKYCTDGILLGEVTRQPLLEQYGIILLDEVHERTLTTDVLLGLVKTIMQRRRDLRVVVMSASLSTGNFADFFTGCHQMLFKGRTHPVEIIYSDWDSNKENYQQRSIAKVIDIHRNEKEGDILLFLTGQDEIEEACDMIEEEVRKNRGTLLEFMEELIVIPLYSAVQHEHQRLILEKNGSGRRCIVSTNVAETSMTIEGVVFVVDPGFCKRKVYNPKTRMDSLMVHKISKASAVQRAGRAGRTRPGKCYRLYTEHRYVKFMKEICPEIEHSNLDNVALRLKKSGVENILAFQFMDPPPRELIVRALELLTNLGALDAAGNITTMGDHICNLPVDPMLARMMIESVRLRCSKEVIIICAMLSSPNCFRRPRKKRQAEADAAKEKLSNDTGDHITLLRIYNAFVHFGKSEQWCFDNYLNFRSLQYADDVCTQLNNLMSQRLNMEVISDPYSSTHTFDILKALVAGSFMKVAYFRQCAPGVGPRARKGVYVTVESQIEADKDAQGYMLHPSSVLFKKGVYAPRPEWVLFNEALQLKSGKNYLSSVSVIRPEWLAELARGYYRKVPSGSELDNKLAEVKRADGTSLFTLAKDRDIVDLFCRILV